MNSLTPMDRDVPVSARVSTDAWYALKREAKERKISVSAILQSLILKHLQETGALDK